MTKTKAASIHFFFSIFIIGLLISTIYFIWYPKPFFNFSGVFEPLKLLIMIDVIIGPLLTFVVYKQGKKLLKLDLSIIVFLQLAAMIYGSFVIYNGRPSTVVFNKGQFHYLIEDFANNDDLIYAELKPNLFSMPKMAYIKNFNETEIYNGYAYFEPISDYDNMLKAYSLTVDNMKAKFSGKKADINKISELYESEDIVFFTLNYKGSIQYVVYSIKQNKIIDYLKF